MAQEKVYAKGIRTFKPHDKARDFVLGTIIITPRELVDWLKGEGEQYLTDYNESKQLKLQVTKGRDGGINVAVDTYRPNTQQQRPAQQEQRSGNSEQTQDDLPF